MYFEEQNFFDIQASVTRMKHPKAWRKSYSPGWDEDEDTNITVPNDQTVFV